MNTAAAGSRRSGFLATTPRGSRVKPGLIVYYPAFSGQQDFDNHYHRALWYLPREEGVVEEVVLGVSDGFALDHRPSFMCRPRQPTNQVRVVPHGDSYEEALREAQLVLVWQRIPEEAFAALDGKRILNVTTNDIDAVEYSNYCKVHWLLSPASRRKTLLEDSHARFLTIRDRITSINSTFLPASLMAFAYSAHPPR